jgi:polar amino acid transport system substrate-binding protein/glutamate/aspartate transport system substrate-binding protein
MLFAIPLLLPQARAQTLSRISESQTMKLGVRADAPPFSFIKPGGQAAGFTVELCIAVAGQVQQHLGLAALNVEFVPVTTEDRFTAVAEGRVDLLCGPDSITLSRRELVDFSLPVFVDGASVLFRADGPNDFKSLEGKVIAVRSATTTEQALENTLILLGVTAKVMAVEDHADGFLALKEKKVDAYFADHSILLYLLAAAGSAEAEGLRVPPSTFTVELYGLALARGDSDFRLVVDRALARMQRGEAFQAIFRANFGTAQPSEGLRYLYRFGALPE